MAYDSKTYGQSPFGAPKKAGSAEEPSVKGPAAKSTATKGTVSDDGLDRGPTDGPNLADKFPKIPAVKLPGKGASKSDAGQSKTGQSKADQSKTDQSKTDQGETGKTGFFRKRFSELGASESKSSETGSTATKSTRKSRAKSTSSKRKSAKKAKAEALAEAEAAELAVAKRFSDEDRRVYLALLYKTGISGLVWAVLRLLRHELSEKAFAVINTLIDPVMIATVSLIGILGITFWSRRLLNDLAQHTRQLQADAESEDDKNYRPTLEIVGDSLEYNPQLRKNLAQIFNATSILLCSLVSYLVTFALFPTDS